MGIQRKAPRVLPRRQPDDILEKNEKIGELLGLEKVAVHTLSWKEQRLNLKSGDCYPVVDMLLKMAEMLAEKPKKPGRPKKE